MRGALGSDGLKEEGPLGKGGKTPPGYESGSCGAPRIFEMRKNPQCIAVDTLPPSLRLWRALEFATARRSLGEVGCGFFSSQKSNITSTSTFSRRVGFAGLP